MSFESPSYLALLFLAPIALLAYAALARWRKRAARYYAPEAPERTVSAVSASLRTTKAGLIVLAVALLAIALARPQIGDEYEVVEQEGADVVIALDVSRSMLAADVEPTRVDQAVGQVELLVDRLRGNRVGYVVFAGTALVRSPLTTDTTSLSGLVASAVEDSLLVEPGSDLGAAVRAALRVLQPSDAESRAIILVSDGEDHEGDALAAASAAADDGILLYASGFGTLSGAAVPGEEPVDGVPVVTQLNEGLLRQMAIASPRGRYATGVELAGVASDINALNPSVLASDRQRLPVERFQWFALAALVLLVAEVLVPEHALRVPLPRRLPRLVAATGGVALIILLGVSCASESADLIADGNDAYQRGDLEEALELYRRAAIEDIDRPEPHYNAGLTLHELEEYELAAASTARALPIDDPEEAARAYYNLGSHYVLQGELEEAFSAFRQSLLLKPDDADAKYNLELVNQLRIQRETNAGTPGEDDPTGDPDADPPSGEANAGLEAQQQAISQELQSVLAAGPEELTVSEALRALELARELNSTLPLSEQVEQPSSSDSPDY